MMGRATFVLVAIAASMGMWGCRAVGPTDATSTPGTSSPRATVPPPTTTARTGMYIQGAPASCPNQAYDDTRTPIDPLPSLVFCNNTRETLVMRRLDKPGLMPMTLPPGTYGRAQSGGPVYGPETSEEARNGGGTLVGVFAEDGSPRGRFLFTPERLLATDQRGWACLSLASEPPFVVRQVDDLPAPCP